MNLKNISWTKEVVEEWLAIAARVERVKPQVRPQGYRNCTLIVLRGLFGDLITDTEAKNRFKPTPEQNTMWEIVMLDWFKLIDSTDDKKIVWLHANGMGWVRIGKRFHLSRQTTANRYNRTIEALAKDLSRLYNF